MSEQPVSSTPGLQQPSSAAPEKPVPSKSLRVWLILLTVASSPVCLLTLAAAILGSFAGFFGFDDPNFTWSQFLGVQGLVWGVAVGMAAFLLAGVVGGWLAYRASRNGVSIIVSLLALLPIGLCLAGIVFFFMTSSSPFPISVTLDH